MTNTLYFGDNLHVLREHIPADSVDLVYLDPPFNSNRAYNVLFQDEGGTDSEAQITAFGDTWHWDRSAEAAYTDLVENASEAVGALIGAMRQFVGASQMMAYLVMMAVRLVELHRVLKPNGSLYLHCDPTASHYLKIILDTIFRPENYRNEIIWKRTGAHNDPLRYGANIDVIFFYSKDETWTWNPIYVAHDEDYEKRFRFTDPDGRRWTDDNLTAKGLSGGGYDYEYKGVRSFWRCPPDTMQRLDSEGRLHFTNRGGIRLKRYLDETKGTPLQALWDDIAPLNSQAAERLGYPTQKPLKLLERIINASSNPGDVVLDPFCGCGTAVVAAQALGRQWIGIDITYIAVSLIRNRIKDMFPDAAYKVIGMPEDVHSARQLAQMSEHDGRYQFQFWALSLVQAKPLGGDSSAKTGKKGADRGIDGVIPFIETTTNQRKQILVQVKSGHVKSGDVRDLRGVIDREKAEMGVFITLEAPTSEMKREAATAGVYHSEHWGRDYPRLQILTIEELLHGANVDMPPVRGVAFKQAPRAATVKGENQLGFDLIDPA